MMKITRLTEVNSKTFSRRNNLLVIGSDELATKQLAEAIATVEVESPFKEVKWLVINSLLSRSTINWLTNQSVNGNSVLICQSINGKWETKMCPWPHDVGKWLQSFDVLDRPTFRTKRSRGFIITETNEDDFENDLALLQRR
jgi:hypothetical protein